MHSSIILTAILLATAGPSFAAPLPQSSSSSFASDDSSSDSEALKLPSFGTIANIASLAVPAIGGLIDHFKNKDPKQARELEELFARQLAVDSEESDALKLPSLGTISTIASVAGPVISGIIDHFKHKDPQQARELEELFARQLSVDDASGAAKLKLEDFKNIASIGSSIVSVAHNVFDSFKGNNNQPQQRELIDLMARELVELAARDDGTSDDSEAISLGAIKTIGKFALKAGGLLGGLFGGGGHSDDQQQQQRRRELLELLAREPVSFLHEINHLPQVRPVISVPTLSPLFKGLNTARHFERDLKDVLDKIDVKEFANRIIVTRSLDELD